MDFDSKYVIVGFPKCGQMSLEKYFIDKGYDIKRHDIIWREKAPEIIRTHDPGRIPIIITRDPIEMIWSSYNYWPYHDSMSFERYLRHRTVRESNLGHENPIEHADYKKHIKRFKDMNPILLTHEEMILNDDYPYENKTDNKPQLPPTYKRMIEEAIESYQNNTRSLLAYR